MKKTLLLLVFCTLYQVAGAQTFAEWFQQKKTQRKYLVEQIAAFRLYASYLQKGYKIAKEGTGLIGNITNGEFSLHQLFFTGLRHVNPAIRSYGKAAEIVSIQASIIATCDSARTRASVGRQFSRQELDMIGGVCSSLLVDVDKTVEELMDVITDDNLQMSDDQRTERINRIHAAIFLQRDAARKLFADVDYVGLSRLRSKTDIGSLGSIYGF